MPEVEGIAGLMDGHTPATNCSAACPPTRSTPGCKGALMETLYPLVELGNVALSFTYPSRVFLIETTMKSEIAFDLEKALE